jgi:hypothetical protein
MKLLLYIGPDSEILWQFLNEMQLVKGIDVDKNRLTNLRGIIAAVHARSKRSSLKTSMAASIAKSADQSGKQYYSLYYISMI